MEVLEIFAFFVSDVIEKGMVGGESADILCMHVS